MVSFFGGKSKRRGKRRKPPVAVAAPEKLTASEAPRQKTAAPKLAVGKTQKRPSAKDNGGLAADAATTRRAQVARAGKPAEIKSPGAGNVKFRTLATGRINRDNSRESELERTRLLLREVFAPGAPVHSKELFAGRLLELENIISSIEDKRSHIIVYGHRGWGKSSLVNTVAEIAREAKYIVVNASCGAAAGFSEMFRSFLSEIPLLYDREMLSSRPDAVESGGFDSLLPEGDFSAKELTDVMSRLTTTRVVMILDEYDRIENEEFKLAITETIKNFSDRSIRVQLLIVGVADTQDQLVGLNPSIRRNISGIQLRLLNEKEAHELITIGEGGSGVEFTDSARDKIIQLSRLTPYNVKLLCLLSAQRAISNQSLTVSEQDVLSAASKAAREAESLLQEEHLELLGPQCSLAKRYLLYGIATATTNRLDEFCAEDVVSALKKLSGTEANVLNVGRRISELVKGPNPMLTRRKVSGKVYYSFVDSMMAFYLRLHSDFDNAKN